MEQLFDLIIPLEVQGLFRLFNGRGGDDGLVGILRRRGLRRPVDEEKLEECSKRKLLPCPETIEAVGVVAIIGSRGMVGVDVDKGMGAAGCALWG